MKALLTGASITLSALLPASAQVLLDKPLLLEGGGRRIQGIASSTAPAEALNAEVAQGNTAQTALVVSGNMWTIELPAFGAQPTTGAHLVVRVPVVSPAPISITLNGSGPYQVFHEGLPLTGEGLVEGGMLSVVFNAGGFHVLNGPHYSRRTCPTGTVAVSDQFCIETSERGSGDYFQAGLACAGDGLRLCSWGEFVAACGQSSALQLTGMTNNWEWTGSTANEDNCGRVVGLGSCEVAGTWFSTGNGPLAFRCCYTR